MFVLFTLKTHYVGQETSEVYEFPDDATEEDISDYGIVLAADHAESYGVHDGDDGCEGDELYWEEHEILNGTREEIIEEWGEIIQA